MEALKNIARQNTAPPTSNSVPATASPFSIPLAQPGIAPPPASQTAQGQIPTPVPAVPALVPASATYSAAPPPVNMPALSYPYAAQPQQPQLPVQAQPYVPPVAGAPQGSGLPGAVPNALPAATAGVDPVVQQQLVLIKLLSEQGIPPDKIPAIIAAIQNGAGTGAGAPPPAAHPSVPHQPPYQTGQQAYGGSWVQAGARPEGTRDRNFNPVRSPPRYHDRSRSRSPRQWDQRGRDYGGFEDDRDRRGRGADYRQRSPPGRRGRSPTPQDFPRPSEKWVDYDRSLPQGHIKGTFLRNRHSRYDTDGSTTVLSRTLFVGGVT